MECCIQLSNVIISRKPTQSLLCTPTLVRDCFHAGLLASVISSQPFRRLNLSPVHPSYLSPTVLNIRWQIKPKTYGYETSVTDANTPKKQIYKKNVRLQNRIIFYEKKRKQLSLSLRNNNLCFWWPHYTTLHSTSLLLDYRRHSSNSFVCRSTISVQRFSEIQLPQWNLRRTVPNCPLLTSAIAVSGIPTMLAYITVVVLYMEKL